MCQTILASSLVCIFAHRHRGWILVALVDAPFDMHPHKLDAGEPYGTVHKNRCSTSPGWLRQTHAWP